MSRLKPLSPRDALALHKLCLLIAAQKGGSGKSMTARVCLEFFRDRNLPVALIDADVKNQDVLKIYEDEVPHYSASFSEVAGRKHHADSIIQGSFQQSLVTNLPANISDSLSEFLVADEQFLVAKEGGSLPIIIYVCMGSVDSLRLFLQSLNERSMVQHIFVQNLYFASSEEWEHIITFPPLQAACEHCHFPIISLPRLDPWLRNVIDEYGVTFHAAAYQWREANLPHWDSSKAHRVHLFLKKAFVEIERGLLACVTHS